MLKPSIKENLDHDGIRYFTEHNGFRADKLINVTELQDAVLHQTGFFVKLQQEKQQISM